MVPRRGPTARRPGPGGRRATVDRSRAGVVVSSDLGTIAPMTTERTPEAGRSTRPSPGSRCGRPDPRAPSIAPSGTQRRRHRAGRGGRGAWASRGRCVAFHLDRLVDAGCATVTTSAATGAADRVPDGRPRSTDRSSETVAASVPGRDTGWRRRLRPGDRRVRGRRHGVESALGSTATGTVAARRGRPVARPRPSVTGGAAWPRRTRTGRGRVRAGRSRQVDRLRNARSMRRADQLGPGWA